MTGAIDPQAFRAALGSFVTGVTIVTASDGSGHDVGVTANSFNSVSLEPPMVLWSLARKSSSLAAFEAASHFAVHVLAADQEDLSNRFAKSGEDKFAGLDPMRGAGGAPLLAGAAAQFQCRTAFRHDGGDHVIFVGEVVEFDRSGKAPLVFHGGRYALAARKAANLSTAREQSAPGGFSEDFIGYLLGRAHFQVYARIRSALARLGLDERDHFALTALGVRGSATAAEIEAAIGYTGFHFDTAAAADLQQRGFVLVQPDGELELTATGRERFVELTAAAMAVEDDLGDALDENELVLLRQLLKHVIRTTDFGLPDARAAGSR